MAKGEVRGEFLGPAEELTVTDGCGDAERQLQILTVLDTSPEGAEVTEYEIDYTSGGKDYTYLVDWQLVACGSETAPDMC